MRFAGSEDGGLGYTEWDLEIQNENSGSNSIATTPPEPKSPAIPFCRVQIRKLCKNTERHGAAKSVILVDT
jgi:hypothetical protein